MEATFVRIQQADGYQTRLFCYETSADVVLGNILILHGMAEHHNRYLSFIRFLNKEGFDVYAYDHRGHGTDKQLSELGYLAKKNGNNLLIQDAITVCRYIKEYGRSEKLSVFGHSMGSIILRCVIQQYHEIDSAIVSSTAVTPQLISSIGLFIANTVCLFRGKKKRSAFLYNMMFGSKPYTSLCSRTAYDWLTRNNTIIGQYISDPYCGFLCTTSFYRDLTKLSKQASLKRNIAKAKRELPILFLTGDKDPVGGYSKHVIRLLKQHTALGFTNASLIIYPEARHELLNELNAEEVLQDILSFLHQNLEQTNL